MKKLISTILCILLLSVPVLSQSWQSIGYGVNYARVNTASTGIFIGYGGWSVQQSWSNKWVWELYKVRLSGLNIGHVYSVQGPADSSYNGREIGNTALAKHMLQLAYGTGTIIIAGHSSGSFVAHELLSHLYVSGLDKGQTKGKIIYYNLDGGTSGLTSTIVNQLKALYCVYSKKGSGESANAASMRYLDGLYSKASSIIIDASSSSCYSSAPWCLHDVMINRNPYNPSTFDLYRDYYLIDSTHPVQTSYLANLGGTTPTSAPTTKPQEVCRPPGLTGFCGNPSNCKGKLYSGYCSGGADNVCCVTSSAVEEGPEVVSTLPPENITNFNATEPIQLTPPNSQISLISIDYLKVWESGNKFGAQVTVTAIKQEINSITISLQFYQSEIITQIWGIDSYSRNDQVYTFKKSMSLPAGSSFTFAFNAKFPDGIIIDMNSGIPSSNSAEVDGTPLEVVPLTTSAEGVSSKPSGEFASHMNRLSTGAIVGIVIGCVCSVALIAGVSFVVVRKRASSNKV